MKEGVIMKHKWLFIVVFIASFLFCQFANLFFSSVFSKNDVTVGAIHTVASSISLLSAIVITCTAILVNCMRNK